MSYHCREEIVEARKMDLLTYLRSYEPEQLVKLSPGIYTTREHGSLKISNGKWMWWSHGVGGVSALDYLIKVRGIPFPKAVEMILDKDEIRHQTRAGIKDNSSKRLLLPSKNKSSDIVRTYLSGRGIDSELIDHCIEKGLLYESLPYHNCVFLGFDEEGIARYAFYRSTNDLKIMGEAAGSDKRYSFRIDRASSTIHVFESAIDLLSFTTMDKIRTGEFPGDQLLSLGGVYTPCGDEMNLKIPAALRQKLEMSPEIKEIILHFDNDIAGKRSAERLIKTLRSSFDIHWESPGFGKDVNDELLFLLQQLYQNE